MCSQPKTSTRECTPCTFGRLLAFGPLTEQPKQHISRRTSIAVPSYTHEKRGSFLNPVSNNTWAHFSWMMDGYGLDAALCLACRSKCLPKEDRAICFVYDATSLRAQLITISSQPPSRCLCWLVVNKRRFVPPPPSSLIARKAHHPLFGACSWCGAGVDPYPVCRTPLVSS